MEEYPLVKENRNIMPGEFFKFKGKIYKAEIYKAEKADKNFRCSRCVMNQACSCYARANNVRLRNKKLRCVPRGRDDNIEIIFVLESPPDFKKYNQNFLHGFV